MRTIRDEILAKTDNGLEVFRHYFGHSIQPKKLFKNPYYNDTKPSCSIFKGSYNDVYMFKDNGNPEYSGDCFSIVGKILGLDTKTNFISIAKAIVNDCNIVLNDNLLLDKNYRKTEVKHIPFNDNIAQAETYFSSNNIKPFTIKHKEFTANELEYFTKSGITKDILDRYNVRSVKYFKSISALGKEYFMYGNEKNPIFDYSRQEGGKLYMPKNNVRYLHFGKKPLDFLFGYEQLPQKGDMVILSAGERDVLSLASAGYNAITLNSETATLHQNLIDDLSSRFNKVLVMYDADETGIKSSTKLCDDFFPHLIRVELPLRGTKEEKDITDFFIKHRDGENGFTRAKEYLKCVIEDDINKHDLLLKSSLPTINNKMKI